MDLHKPLKLACNEFEYEREWDYTWITKIRIGFSKLVQIILFVTFLRIILEAHPVVQGYPTIRGKKGRVNYFVFYFLINKSLFLLRENYFFSAKFFKAPRRKEASHDQH